MTDAILKKQRSEGTRVQDVCCSLRVRSMLSCSDRKSPQGVNHSAEGAPAKGKECPEAMLKGGLQEEGVAFFRILDVSRKQNFFLPGCHRTVLSWSSSVDANRILIEQGLQTPADILDGALFGIHAR